MEFCFDKERTALLVDLNEYSGVKKVCGWLADDFALVTESRPDVKELLSKAASGKDMAGNIVIGTAFRHGLIDEICSRLEIDISCLKGKNEVYGIFLEKGTLIIAGSDKRGTIYGILHVSEAMGVTPLCYFGDTVPVKYSGICFAGGSKESSKDILYADPFGISKEPSVKYRGFFINDEWPAFGNWCNRHFGGFTAACYEKVFEYLLRLKGNYMWPAMWSSVFSEDGPGLESAELADELGIVMGTSHHEPCCRAGEEFSKLSANHPEYGKDWSFISNRDGVVKFWEDGLKRNGSFENVITVGMRGERDSKLFKDARLIDNINVLKSVIECQKELINRYTDGNRPLMLAVYKEVEEYYMGDAETKGLKDWDGLDGITLMLCDDNFGNLRYMMDEDKRSHKGGYGMYYHFDYHGGPVSYEWINSSYLPKIWEQMTTAYDFGIRDIWIVNVGDLKNQELPLSYFLDLAYDFEKYGTDAKVDHSRYLDDFVNKNFNGLRNEDKSLIKEIIDGYTRLNNIVKPEVLNDSAYSITAYNEAFRVLSIAKELEKKTLALMSGLDPEYRNAFESIAGYQALATFNLVKMHIYSAYNKRNAGEGRMSANKYAKLVKKCIDRDRQLTEEFHTFVNGKWYGMGLSKHIGFKAWNEEGCRLPVMVYVEAQARNDVVITDEDSNTFTGGGDWTKRPLKLTGFDYSEEGHFSISTSGTAPVTYAIDCDDENIIFYGKNNEFITSGIADCEHDVFINVRMRERSRCTKHEFMIKTSAGNVNVYFETKINAIIPVEAFDYYKLYDGTDGMFEKIFGFGRLLPKESGGALKAYPQNRVLADGPVAEYRVEAPLAGEYKLCLYTAPSNPHRPESRISALLIINDGEPQKVDTVPENYAGGENSCRDWCMAVILNSRKTTVNVQLHEGENSVKIKAVDPGFVLCRLVFAHKDMIEPESRLGAV